MSWEPQSVLFIRSESSPPWTKNSIVVFHALSLLSAVVDRTLRGHRILAMCLIRLFFFSGVWRHMTCRCIYQINVLFFSTEKLTFQNAPSPQEFNEGDDAVIVCDVISSPPPTIIWKYQRAKIQPEKDGKKSILSAIFTITSLFLLVIFPHSLMWTSHQIAAFSEAVMFLSQNHCMYSERSSCCAVCFVFFAQSFHG